MAAIIAEIVAKYQSDISQKAPADKRALDELAKSAGGVAEATEVLDRSFSKVNGSFDSVERKIYGQVQASAALEAAQRKLANSTRLANEAAATDPALAAKLPETLRRLQIDYQNTVEQINKRAGELEKRFGTSLGNVGATANQTGYLLRQMGLQMTDVTQQLVSGAPVFTTLVQQFGQVYGIAQSQGEGAFRRLSIAIQQMITPMNLLKVGAAGVVATFAGFGVMYESQQRQLLQVQAQLRGYREDWLSAGQAATTAAKQFAAATDVSRSDATKAASTLLSGTALNPQSLQSQLAVARDMATVMGTTLPEAASKLVQAMRSPNELVDELWRRNFPGFDNALRENVQNLVAAGRITDAYNLTISNFQRVAKGAADEALTPLQKALNALVKEFTIAGTAGESLADQLGRIGVGTVITGIDALRELIHNTETDINNIRELWVAFWNTPVGNVLIDAVQAFTKDFKEFWNGTIGFLRNEIFVFVNDIKNAFEELKRIYGAGRDLFNKGSSSAASLQDLEAGASTAMSPVVGGAARVLGRGIQMNLDTLRNSYQSFLGGQGATEDADTIQNILFGGERNKLAIQGAAQTIWDTFSQTFNEAAKGAGTLTDGIIQSLKEAADGQGAGAGLRAAGEHFADTFGDGVIDGLKKVGQNSLAAMFPSTLGEAATSGSSSDLDVLRRLSSSYPQQVQDLVQRIAMRESGGSQTDFMGRLTMGAAGEIGMMQIMPATGAGLGYSREQLGTVSGNAQAGLDLIWHLVQKYKNPDLVALAYNWGETQTDRFLAGQTSLNQRAAGYAQGITGASLDKLQSYGGSQPGIGGVAGGAQFDQAQQNQNRSRQYADEAKSLGTAAQAREEALRSIQKWTEALKLEEQQGGKNTVAIATYREAITQAYRAIDAAVTPAQQLARSQQEEEEATKALTEAYGQGYHAVAQVLAANQALADQRERLGRTNPELIAAVKEETTELLRRKSVLDDNALAAKALDVRTQTQDMANEAAVVAGSAREREILVAGLKAEAEARRSNSEATKEGIQQIVAAAQQQAAVQHDIQAIGSSVQAVTGTITSSFDTIGNAITEAFVQGQGAAVNWGNVLKGVATQVLQSFLKFAVLNPLMNGLFGGSIGYRDAPTLELALAGFGAGGGGGGVGGFLGGSPLGMLGTAGTLYNAGGALGLIPGGGGLGGLFGGTNGIFAPISSGINSILGTQLIAPAQGALATGAPLSSLAGYGGLTIGGLIAGGGLGYGIGSLAGGYLQGALGKTGPGPSIGSGLGALGGAAIGSIIPGVGTIIGGLLGGLLGGGTGAFFGPRPASAYSSTGVDITTNGINIGGTLAQIVDVGEELKNLQQQVVQINESLKTFDLTITTSGQHFQIGQNTPGGFQDPTKFADFYAPNATGQSLFGNLRFASDSDPRLSGFLSQQSFNNLPELQTFIQNYKQGQAAVKDFFENTIPGLVKAANTFDVIKSKITAPYDAAIAQAEALKRTIGISADDTQRLTLAESQLASAREEAVQVALDAAQKQYKNFFTNTVNPLVSGTGTSGLDQAISGLNNTFDQAVQGADDLKTAFGLSADQIAALTEAENNLSASREVAIQRARDEAYAQIDRQASGYSVRAAQAGASASGDMLSNMQAAMTAFEVSAAQELDQWRQTLLSTLGASIDGTDYYYQKIGQLENALGAERVAIVQQWAKQIAQATQAVNDNTVSWAQRVATAQAALSHDPQQGLNAQLFNFDLTAQQQLRDYDTAMVNLWGITIRQNENYLSAMAQAERALGLERLQIIDQYNEQIKQKEEANRQQAAQTAGGIIEGYSSYVSGLQGTANDPRSPMAQYEGAQTEFRQAQDKAIHGDLRSIQNLTQYSQAYLNAAQATYGHGQQYVAAYQEVVGSLGMFNNPGGADWLTNVVLQSEIRTQTQTLVDSIAALGVKLDAVNLNLRGTNAPARAYAS